MGAKAENQKIYPVSIEYFAAKTRAIGASGLNLSLKSENPMPDGVWFRILHGMSAASYGEKITVTLKALPGQTSVHIHSECGLPTQLVDYGKNRKNVEAIFAYFEQGIESAPAAPAVQTVAPAPQQTPAPEPQPTPAPQPEPVPAPALQPATAPQPAPAPQPVRTHVFCASCGAKNNINANFCYGCGRKLYKNGYH